jgi:hypothetical protein
MEDEVELSGEAATILGESPFQDQEEDDPQKTRPPRSARAE